MLQRVYTKANKRNPSIETDYLAEVTVGKSICIRRDTIFDEPNPNAVSKTFALGDYAEFDSYNLSYYGPIISITPKTVSIIHRYDVDSRSKGNKVKVHRLDLNTFCWRNHDFDLNKTVEENAITSQHI